MRRILAPLLLALVLLSAPAAASADVLEVPADALVLAAEDALVLAAEDALVLAAEADGAPLGPDPQPRDQLDNPARSLAGYEDPELQFTWAASFILLVVGVIGLVIGGGLWYLLVMRPEQQETA